MFLPMCLCLLQSLRSHSTCALYCELTDQPQTNVAANVQGAHLKAVLLKYLTLSRCNGCCQRPRQVAVICSKKKCPLSNPLSIHSLCQFIAAMPSLSHKLLTSILLHKLQVAIGGLHFHCCFPKNVKPYVASRSGGNSEAEAVQACTSPTEQQHKGQQQGCICKRPHTEAAQADGGCWHRPARHFCLLPLPWTLWHGPHHLPHLQCSWCASSPHLLPMALAGVPNVPQFLAQFLAGGWWS